MTDLILDILNLETPILIVDGPAEAASSSAAATVGASEPPRGKFPVRTYSDALYINLYDSQRIDLSFLETQYKGKTLIDPLPDSYFQPSHKKAERLERSIRNSEKGRAQHEKDQIIRLLEGLQGPDWLRTMGVSGITESRKKSFEPARMHFIRGCQVILEKFRLWNEEEKRRKAEKDKRRAQEAEATSEESEDQEAAEEEEEGEEEEEEVEEEEEEEDEEEDEDEEESEQAVSVEEEAEGRDGDSQADDGDESLEDGDAVRNAADVAADEDEVDEEQAEDDEEKPQNITNQNGIAPEDEIDELAGDPDPPEYSDVDESIAKQLRDEVLARSKRNRMKSFSRAGSRASSGGPSSRSGPTRNAGGLNAQPKSSSRPGQKPQHPAADVASRKRRTRAVVWGQPVPEPAQSEFKLPKEIRDSPRRTRSGVAAPAGKRSRGGAQARGRASNRALGGARAQSRGRGRGR
jgi:DNA polymerase III gamma/tau subunit